MYSLLKLSEEFSPVLWGLNITLQVTLARCRLAKQVTLQKAKSRTSGESFERKRRSFGSIVRGSGPRNGGSTSSGQNFQAPRAHDGDGAVLRRTPSRTVASVR